MGKCNSKQLEAEPMLQLADKEFIQPCEALQILKNAWTLTQSNDVLTRIYILGTEHRHNKQFAESCRDFCKRHNFKAQSELLETCSICFKSKGIGGTLWTCGTCRQSFHQTCAKQWFQKARTCPTCRTTLA